MANLHILLLHGVRVALVAGGLFAAVNAFWFVTTGPEVLPVESQAYSPTGPRTVGSMEDVRSMNLFGEVVVAPVAPPPIQATETLQETKLSLVLVGVFMADEADASSALIARDRQAADIYYIGDQLPGGARLVEVHPTHVVIERAGIRELVRFAEPRVQITQESVANPSRAPGAGLDSWKQEPRRGVREPPSGGGGGGGGGSSGLAPDAGEFVRNNPSAQDVYDHYREALDADPDSVLLEFGVRPVAEGQAQGYAVGDRPELLARTGLQPGDRILSVNGRPVGNVAEDRAEIENVISQGSARIEIQRGSRRFFITVSL